MHLPPFAFIQAFLVHFNAQRTIICLDNISDGAQNDDSYPNWLLTLVQGYRNLHQISFLTAKQISVEMENIARDKEKTFILCPKLHQDMDFHAKALEYNVAWLVSNEYNKLERATENLRLDSRFFTYKVETDSSFQVHELFRVKGGPILTNFYGVWTTEEVLEVPKPAIWTRRNDLNGVELTDVLLEWRPFLNLDRDGDFSKTNGVFVDFLNFIQASLNFTIKRFSPPDGQWGVLEKFNETHSKLTGLAGELLNKRADLCTAGMYMYRDRLAHIDMITALADYSTIIMPKNLASTSGQINAMAYVKIFSWTIWILGLTSCLLITLFFALSGFYLARGSSKQGACSGLAQGIQVTYLSMLQLSSTIDWDPLPIRAAVITVSVLAVVLFASYCGDLTAKMTHRAPPVSIQNFQDVLNAGLKVRIVKGSALEAYFQDAQPGSAMDIIYQQILSEPSLFLDDFSHAFDQLEEHGDFVTFDSELGYIAAPFADPLKYFQEKVPVHVSWSFQPNSELTEVFSYHLTRLNEGGLMDRILDEWLSGGRPDGLEGRIFVEDALPLGYDNLLFPMMVLLCGLAVSIVLLALEWGKKCMNNGNNNAVESPDRRNKIVNNKKRSFC